MSIGVPLKEIKHSTLSDLSFYDEAYIQKREMIDEMMWMNGMYTMEAIKIVVSGMFAKQGQTPEKYMERPMLMEYRERNRVLTEEEKQEQIQMLFSNLTIMQGNFERTHGEKRNA